MAVKRVQKWQPKGYPRMPRNRSAVSPLLLCLISLAPGDGREAGHPNWAPQGAHIPVQLRSLIPVQDLQNWLQHRVSQRCDQRLHPNIIHNDPIIVH